MTCRKEVHPLVSTSLEALRRHRAVHADAPESRRVWLFHSHAYFDHGVPERIAEARAFMDLVIRTFAGTDHLEVHGFPPFPAGPHRRGSFEVLFTREAFADSVSWLMFSRPPLARHPCPSADGLAVARPHATRPLARHPACD